MHSLFLFALALGGAVLVLQLVLSLAGIGHEGHDFAAHHHGGEHGEGLHLFSVRAMAAALAFFGLVGWSLGLAGLPGWAAAGGALVAGFAAMVAVAALVRAMTRLERDAAVRIEGAVGLPATVYVPVPAARGGAGKVFVTLQERMTEFQAVTTHAQTLPSGAAVVVVDVLGPDTVEVVPNPSLGESLVV